MKTLQKNAFLFAAGYLFAWCCLVAILPSFISEEYNPVGFLQLLKAHAYKANVFSDGHYWSTSLGVTTRILIELSVTSTLIWCGSLLFGLKLSFRTVIVIVILAHSIFILQYLAEFLYMKINWRTMKGMKQEDFSLFSVSYFLAVARVKYHYAFSYPFQILGIFEIVYWVLLVMFTKRISGTKLSSAIGLITGAYIFPLLIWLSFGILISLT